MIFKKKKNTRDKTKFFFYFCNQCTYFNFLADCYSCSSAHDIEINPTDKPDRKALVALCLLTTSEKVD